MRDNDSNRITSNGRNLWETKSVKHDINIMIYTSSAVLATASKPVYAKNAVAESAIMPSTAKGKYLLPKQETSFIQ